MGSEDHICKECGHRRYFHDTVIGCRHVSVSAYQWDNPQRSEGCLCACRKFLIRTPGGPTDGE